MVVSEQIVQVTCGEGRREEKEGEGRVVLTKSSAFCAMYVLVVEQVIPNPHAHTVLVNAGYPPLSEALDGPLHTHGLERPQEGAHDHVT